MLSRLILLVSVPLFLLLVGSFLGAFHPLGDSLAVFRGPLTGASAVAVILLWRGGRSLAALAAVLVLWSSYPLIGLVPFSSGLFRAIIAVKEVRNGNKIHRRVSA